MTKSFITSQDELLVKYDDWAKVEKILGLLGYADCEAPIGETLDNAYQHIQIILDEAKIGRLFKVAVDASNNT